MGWSKLALATVLLGLLVAGKTVAYGAFINFNDPGFASTWERVDRPVTGLGSHSSRGYTWGPPVAEALTTTVEPYNGTSRKVQYFDKARMEVNNPNGNPQDLFYVTTGLLVKEMVSGQEQDGDTTFKPLSPGTIQVAGDSNENGGNSIAPTYADFKAVATLQPGQNTSPAQPGKAIAVSLAKAGKVIPFTPPEQRLDAGYDDVTGHNIADIFVQFNEQTGLIWNGHDFEQGKVFFNNAVYVLGRPITEPYWVRAVVAGTERDVLVQLFERRVLTYTPTNPAGYKVEMGNVGQHYYRWRYSANRNILLTTSALGHLIPPVVTGHYIFWQDSNSATHPIYGYDLGQQSQFLVTNDPAHKFGLASDGHTLMWFQNYADSSSITQSSVHGYDLATRQLLSNPTSIPVVRAGEDSGLALDNGILYYEDRATNHKGLYAYNLATGQTRLISPRGTNPKAADGLVMWAEQDEYLSSFRQVWSFHLLKLDGSIPDTVLDRDVNGWAGTFSISGKNVVWYFDERADHPGLKVYNLETKTTRVISTNRVFTVGGPVIRGNKLVWTSDRPGEGLLYLLSSDLSQNNPPTVLKSGQTVLTTWGFTAEGALLYGVESDSESLYLTYDY